jgi:hypothetical protein
MLDLIGVADALEQSGGRELADAFERSADDGDGRVAVPEEINIVNANQ